MEGIANSIRNLCWHVWKFPNQNIHIQYNAIGHQLFFLISIFGGKKFRLCAGAVLKHMPNHIDYKLQADKGRKSKVRVQGHWWNLQAVKYPRKMTKIKTKVESAKLIKPAAKNQNVVSNKQANNGFVIY